MTWRELTRQMLWDGGLVSDGQVPTADFDARALTRLNQILSDWSAAGVLPPALDTITKVLTANQYAYTCGTGGDLTRRPLELDSVFVTGSTLGSIKSEVVIRDFIKWNKIQLPTVASIPNLIAINPGFPLATIYLNPAPISAFTLSISGKFAWAELSQDDMEDEISLPPGYEAPLIAQGAWRLAKSSRISTPEIAQTAALSYKELCVSLPYAPAVQPNPRAGALNTRGSGTYNWLADQPSR